MLVSLKCCWNSGKQCRHDVFDVSGSTLFSQAMSLQILRVITIFNISITKTSLFKHVENFTNKSRKLSDKNSDNYLISAQKKDCGF